MKQQDSDDSIHIIPTEFQKSVDEDLKILTEVEKHYTRKFRYGLGRMKKRLIKGLKRKADLEYSQKIGDIVHQKEESERASAMNREYRSSLKQ